MTGSALLALEDGSIFKGIGIGAEGASTGEVVFNTSMMDIRKYSQILPTLNKLSPLRIHISVIPERTKKITNLKRYPLPG